MSAREVLMALADRCEREEPSRELDVAIATGLGWTPKFEPMPNEMWASEYTTSLDAAVTLVPDGWVWRMGSPGWAVLTHTDRDGQIDGRSMVPPRPAMALCAAALRARATVSEGEA